MKSMVQKALFVVIGTRQVGESSAYTVYILTPKVTLCSVVWSPAMSNVAVDKVVTLMELVCMLSCILYLQLPMSITSATQLPMSITSATNCL